MQLLKQAIRKGSCQCRYPTAQPRQPWLTEARSWAPLSRKILNPNLQTVGATAVYYFDRNFKLPEIHQADLTLQQDLGWNTSLAVSWLAAFGRRLPSFVDTNLPQANGTISYTVVDPTWA